MFSEKRLEAGRYRCMECKAEVVLEHREESPVCTVCGASTWEPIKEDRRFERGPRSKV